MNVPGSECDTVRKLGEDEPHLVVYWIACAVFVIQGVLAPVRVLMLDGPIPATGRNLGLFALMLLAPPLLGAAGITLCWSPLRRAARRHQALLLAKILHANREMFSQALPEAPGQTLEEVEYLAANRWLRAGFNARDSLHWMSRGCPDPQDARAALLQTETFWRQVERKYPFRAVSTSQPA
jgi:hypothetical protein